MLERVEALLREAARRIASAEALLLTAGAGMGVDSGLPDFRGDEGLWRACPPYAKLGLSFAELANPRWFATDPEPTWGFYGHRLGLYRRTVPHGGFAVLRRIAAAIPEGARVYTSNVDGQFQRAGFCEADVVECHGAIDFVQCVRGSGAGIVRFTKARPRRWTRRASALANLCIVVNAAGHSSDRTCSCSATSTGRAHAPKPKKSASMFGSPSREPSARGSW